MNKKIIKSTGTVIPLGDGATGKSLLVQLLHKAPSELYDVVSLAQSINKSLNLEIEFGTRSYELDDNIIETIVRYYVFPGQKEMEYKSNRTFEYVYEAFKRLPDLRKVSVLLLVYDTSRFESVNSLEYWLNMAIMNKWLHNKTKIILVSNKVDLQRPDKELTSMLVDGIFEILKNEENLDIPKSQISCTSVSSLTLEGINQLRDDISEWIRDNGKRLDRMVFG